MVSETGLTTDWAMDDKPKRIVRGANTTTYPYDAMQPTHELRNKGDEISLFN